MDGDLDKDLLRKMLGSPDCQFEQKWVDEAILEWVDWHMYDFLKKNPQLCWIAAQDNDYLPAVMEAIPITDEYETLIRQIIRRVSELNFPPGTETAFHRFIAADRADLLAEITPQYLQKGAIWSSVATIPIPILDIIYANSEAAVQVMCKVDWRRVKWSTDVVLAAISKLSPEELQKVIKTSNLDSCIKDMPLGVITAICQKLPLGALKAFVKKHRKTIEHAAQHLVCMACGRDDFRSVSGYALHRKKCDPTNQTPDIKEILVTRLGHVFKSSPQIVAPAHNT